MKVTLDLDALLRNQEITPDEYEKLKRLASASISTLAFNLFVGFGVITVAAAALALVPTPLTAVLIGAVVLIVGLTLGLIQSTQWRLLANICLLIGALMAAGGLIVDSDGSLASLLGSAVAFAIIAALSRSSLMAVLAVLLLAGSVQADTTHLFASYDLRIHNPIYTIVGFSALALGLHRLAKGASVSYVRPLEAAVRASVFVVNIAFWVGSMWAERPTEQGRIGETFADGFISAPLFAVLWALALLAGGIWAWRHNSRWVLNIVVVFAALNLYTQWFEYLDTSPGTVLIAGLFALAVALGVRFMNTAMQRRGEQTQEGEPLN